MISVGSTLITARSWPYVRAIARSRPCTSPIASPVMVSATPRLSRNASTSAASPLAGVRSVVVAVVAMRVVQVTGHDVVHVISVLHRLVTAVRAVLVLGVVVVAVVVGRALVRVGFADRHVCIAHCFL